MQLWTLWKRGPDRDPSGGLAAQLDAARANAGKWTESPRGSRRYQLGAEGDSTYLVIEPDVAPDHDWAPRAGAHRPAATDRLDENAHSLH